MVTETFAVTGAEQTYQVPADVEEVLVEAWGGQGGSANAAGGQGGYAQGILPTTPGETLYIYVGDDGADDGPAGWPNGGDANTAAPAGGGAGSSDIRQGGNAVGDQVLVAGGGGGSGGENTGDPPNHPGGGGGGLQGEDGGGDELGGSGGTQTAGGSAGSSATGSATAGARNQGGDGSARFSGHAGGGGGGGYYGGGGGGNTDPATGSGGGGGGGGSSYLDGVLTAASTTAGQQSGPGSVVITLPPSPPSGLQRTDLSDGVASFELVDESTVETEFRLYQSTSSPVSRSDSVVDTVATGDEAGTGGTVSVSASGLADGTTYYWAVAAYDSETGLESALSSEVSGTTILPAATDLTVDSIDGDQVTVSWTVRAGNGQHRVEVTPTGSDAWVDDSGALGLGTTAYETSALLDGERYSIRVVTYTDDAEIVDASVLGTWAVSGTDAVQSTQTVINQ